MNVNSYRIAVQLLRELRDAFETQPIMDLITLFDLIPRVKQFCDDIDNGAITNAEESWIERAYVEVDTRQKGRFDQHVENVESGYIPIPEAKRYLLSAIADSFNTLRRYDAARPDWKHPIIEALIINHILKSEHETDPQKALMDLLAWETEVALDPVVSEQARELINKRMGPVIDLLEQVTNKWLNNQKVEDNEALVAKVRECIKSVPDSESTDITEICLGELDADDIDQELGTALAVAKADSKFLDGNSVVDPEYNPTFTEVDCSKVFDSVEVPEIAVAIEGEYEMDAASYRELELATVEYDYRVHPEAMRRIRLLFPEGEQESNIRVVIPRHSGESSFDLLALACGIAEYCSGYVSEVFMTHYDSDEERIEQYHLDSITSSVYSMLVAGLPHLEKQPNKIHSYQQDAIDCIRSTYNKHEVVENLSEEDIKKLLNFRDKMYSACCYLDRAIPIRGRDNDERVRFATDEILRLRKLLERAYARNPSINIEETNEKVEDPANKNDTGVSDQPGNNGTDAKHASWCRHVPGSFGAYDNSCNCGAAT